MVFSGMLLVNTLVLVGCLSEEILYDFVFTDEDQDEK